MSRRSPAQVFALVIGLSLVAGGVLGFFYEASFETGGDTPRDAALGILDVNGWHNVVHIATGAAGLLVAGYWSASRLYALALAAVYAVVALAGFIEGDGGVLIGLVPVNTEDNVLHALIALAGLIAGQATPAEPPPTLAEPAATG
jgi:hypothetical protein